MPPQVLPLSHEELVRVLFGLDLAFVLIGPGAAPELQSARNAIDDAKRAIATIEALQAENEAAKVRAYRALRIVEPNMDQYAGACAVYSAAFETLEPPTLAESELDSLHSQLDTQAQELARVKAEAATWKGRTLPLLAAAQALVATLSTCQDACCGSLTHDRINGELSALKALLPKEGEDA